MIDQFKPHPSQISKAVLTLLYLSLAVIVWGAWVRISFSGDGCADTWPLCQNQLLPSGFAPQKTWVEWTHRLMSGVFGLAVFLLSAWVWLKKTSSRREKLWAGLSALFTVTEALLGAKLVLLRLVGTNDSPFRAFSMGQHLVNSLILVGAIYLWWEATVSCGKELTPRRHSPLMIQFKKIHKTLVACSIGFVCLLLTGAIAALSTTLFPAQNFLQSYEAQSLSSHYLMNLRSFHPFLGVLMGMAVASAAFLFRNLVSDPIKDSHLEKQLVYLGYMALAAVAVGSLTLLLSSPLVLKLSHLLMTYAFWIQGIRTFRALRFETFEIK